MNKEEYLFQIISEEAAEVTQAISKILRFGKDNSNPIHAGGTNEDDLLEEFYQMCAVIEYMQQNGFLKTLSQSEIDKIKNNKIINVCRYALVSRHEGTLIDDDTSVISEKAGAYDKLSAEYEKVGLLAHDYDGSESKAFAYAACDIFCEADAKIETIRKAKVFEDE